MLQNEPLIAVKLPDAPVIIGAFGLQNRALVSCMLYICDFVTFKSLFCSTYLDWKKLYCGILMHVKNWRTQQDLLMDHLVFHVILITLCYYPGEIFSMNTSSGSIVCIFLWLFLEMMHQTIVIASIVHGC